MSLISFYASERFLIVFGFESSFTLLMCAFLNIVFFNEFNKFGLELNMRAIDFMDGICETD